MQAALQVLRQHLTAPPPGPELAMPMNELAWSLVDPRNPVPAAREVALAVAEAATAASDRRNHTILDTLAEALHANGRSADAATVEEEALAKCPVGHVERPSLEASAARFRAAAVVPAGR